MRELALALALVLPALRPSMAAVRAIEAAAAAHAVPAPLLAAVCVLEGGVSERGWWCGVVGAPAAVQPTRAAHALARWRRDCGDWRGAVQRFRHGGNCRGRDTTGYVARALHLAARIAQAGGPR